MWEWIWVKGGKKACMRNCLCLRAWKIFLKYSERMSTKELEVNWKNVRLTNVPFRNNKYVSGMAMNLNYFSLLTHREATSKKIFWIGPDQLVDICMNGISFVLARFEISPRNFYILKSFCVSAAYYHRWKLKKLHYFCS